MPKGRKRGLREITRPIGNLILAQTAPEPLLKPSLAGFVTGAGIDAKAPQATSTGDHEAHW